jgi:hypothetical protein
MSKWIKRPLVVLFLILWLLVMLTPTLAVVLARNEQLQWGSPSGPHTRLFLLKEAKNEGLGLERAREVLPPAGAADTVYCLQTTVRYWMWTPGVENQPVEYCQCIDAATGGTIQELPPSCQVP